MTASTDYEKAYPAAVPTQSPDLSETTTRVYPVGLKGRVERVSDFLVEHGVEERGIQPRPEDVSAEDRVDGVEDMTLTEIQERERLSWRSYFPQLTFWAALNTNILTVRRA